VRKKLPRSQVGAGLVFITCDDIAAFDVGQSLIDARLCRSKIVAPLSGALRDPFVDKLPRGPFG
jgi:hypothetical protein